MHKRYGLGRGRPPDGLPPLRAQSRQHCPGGLCKTGRRPEEARDEIIARASSVQQPGGRRRQEPTQHQQCPREDRHQASRRLSKIFHRDSGESGLGVLPRAVGTVGMSQPAICQSPRIQRRRRSIPVSSGRAASNNFTSPANPQEAKQPSIKLWLRTRLSGKRPADYRLEGGHVVNPLADKAALGEEVLIDVARLPGIGIDTGVAGEDAAEPAAVGLGHGYADVRLQEGVSAPHRCVAGSSCGPFKGWAAAATNSRAASRGSRVSASSVIT